MQLKPKIKMPFNLSETVFREVKSFFMIIVLRIKNIVSLWLLKLIFNLEVKNGSYSFNDDSYSSLCIRSPFLN
jgi:hypothetical protein